MIKRRLNFLRSSLLALAAVLLATVCAAADLDTASIVQLRIDANHPGSGIYGGIWVGKGSPIPNVRGIRSDVVGALRALHVPNIRWPGGCFGDEYHWRDGIGPAANRKTTVNANWGGAAAEWMAYMTADSATSAGKERAANGHSAPYRVKFVGIGNESWGCGGAIRPCAASR